MNITQRMIIPLLSDEDAGRDYYKWSFVFVYSLESIKDLYLLVREYPNENLKQITIRFNEKLTTSDKWNERKVLEYLNALVKFDLVIKDESGYSLASNLFINSKLFEPLTESDFNDLRSVFFSYFRFRECSSFFTNIGNLEWFNFELFSKKNFLNDSKPLYYFSDKHKATNCFLSDVNGNVLSYVLENEAAMRFWDVFVKWGVSLRVLERFNINNIINHGMPNEVSICYFINEPVNFNLCEFIINNFTSRHIWIPELIYKVALNYRFSVEKIKELIIREITSNKDLTFERTSEIFLIKGKNNIKRINSATYLFPKLNNSFISHLIIRK
ncbi:hypothetical protein [Flectobacillus major]|uniref:hypothetical protein n=1 Tax=Flectobacillus major TaxID=103 RepID=UPI00047E5675|nr:hypothetical protein [Flectobacillus major]